MNRLISQKLLKQQIGSEATQSADAQKAAAKTLSDVRKEFPSEAAYHSALQALGMSEPQVLRRLALYQRTLRMIDGRLRPSSWPDQDEIEAYYKQTFVPEYSKGHNTPPPLLEQVQDQIQEILVQEKMNQQLARWLERLKSTSRVTIHSD